MGSFWTAPSHEGAAPMATGTSTTQLNVTVDGIGPVPVSLTEHGSGRPFLLLHGGAGPQSVDGFADLLAAEEPARVLVPTHPGFGGAPRPAAPGSIASLGPAYTRVV